MNACDELLGAAGAEALPYPVVTEREGRIATLPVAELARVWIALNSASPVEKARDDNAANLFDYEWGLVPSDPERTLALILAVLALEDDPYLLGVLAAGLLENLIPSQEGAVFDAVVAEAERNPRFRRLLAGVYYTNADDALVARLETVTDRRGF